MEINVNVRVDFPAMDKVATLLCMQNGMLDKAIDHFVNKVVENAPVVEETVAEEVVAEAPVVEQKPKRRTKAKTAPVVEETVPEPAPEPVPVIADEPETLEAVVVDEPEAVEEKPAQTVCEPVEMRHFSVQELYQCATGLKDKDAANLGKVKALFSKYGITGFHGLEGDQDMIDRFAADLIEMGGEF